MPTPKEFAESIHLTLCSILRTNGEIKKLEAQIPGLEERFDIDTLRQQGCSEEEAAATIKRNTFNANYRRDSLTLDQCHEMFSDARNTLLTLEQTLIGHLAEYNKFMKRNEEAPSFEDLFAMEVRDRSFFPKTIAELIRHSDIPATVKTRLENPSSLEALHPVHADTLADANGTPPHKTTIVGAEPIQQQQEKGCCTIL